MYMGYTRVDKQRVSRWPQRCNLCYATLNITEEVLHSNSQTNKYLQCVYESTRVCVWVLLHKPSNLSKERYFLHCFWSPSKEMNAKWNYTLEIITFTYNSCTKDDFQRFEIILVKIRLRYWLQIAMLACLECRQPRNLSSGVCVQYSTVPVYVSWPRLRDFYRHDA